MYLKLLGLFCALAFISQIGFSIYYSLKIVDENTRINTLQQELSESTISHQTIKYNLAKINSLEIVSTHPDVQNLVPITSTIDLTK